MAQENTDDKYVHGTIRVGSDVHGSKLVPDDVRAIRKLGKTTPVAVIARQYGLNKENIYRILRGDNWGWLED